MEPGVGSASSQMQITSPGMDKHPVGALGRRMWKWRLFPLSHERVLAGCIAVAVASWIWA